MIAKWVIWGFFYFAFFYKENGIRAELLQKLLYMHCLKILEMEIKYIENVIK